MTITSTDDRLEVVHESDADSHPRAEAPPGQSVGQGPGAALDQASSRPTFTITDAATACSVSRKTITRKLPELAGHGAAKDDDGVWRIPVEALLAVGLHPGRSLPEAAPTAARPVAPPHPQVRPVEQDTVTIPRDRWDDVRIRLARAEAEAAERGLALADARLALRALTAGPVTAAWQGNSAIRTDVATPRTPDAHVPTADPAGQRPTDGEGQASLVAPGASTPLGGAQRIDAGPPATSPAAAEPGQGQLASPEGDQGGSLDIVAARNLAARTGGYVPAGAAPAKRRRWWQSR
ncbi:MAG TPA: hypothetical protein VLQ92_09820 [Candidatus Limnocylindrales bacterium]|nr:hypothetical protein [Candidatus Limnocylindrales bacterium]